MNKSTVSSTPSGAFAMLSFGTGFGFILSRVGATNYDAISQMFRLTDLHLAGVIAVAVTVAGLGFRVLRHRGVAGPEQCPVVLKPKPRKVGNIVGGMIFGAGWAMTGTCPGTSLAMLGEGQIMAAFVLFGIVVGVALHRRYGSKVATALTTLTPKWAEVPSRPATPAHPLLSTPLAPEETPS